MTAHTVGELVTVAAGGPELDGIVFDTPSREKVVVAVVDPARGPGFRSVHPRTLIARAEAGPHDAALDRLIRRTPAPPTRRPGGGAGAERGRAGHTREAMHRATGK